MRKKTWITIALCFVFLFTTALVSSVCAKTGDVAVILSAELDLASAEAYAMKEIKNIIASKDPRCIWTEETKILSKVALYDCDDVCFGYVFKLSTNGEETGYIQVNYLDGEIFTYCRSYQGIPAYEGLAKEGLARKLEEQSEKLYFFGNMSYCYKTEKEEYTPIDSVAKIAEDDAKEYFQEIMTHIVQRRRERLLEKVAEKNSNYSFQESRSFSLVTTSDFSNLYATRPNGTRQVVTEHCSPTAATNIMLYFRDTGESPLSSSLSNSTIFMALYYGMDTNSISTSNTISATGTQWANIQPGISGFCSSRGCIPSTIGTVTTMNLTDIQQHLDNGELLQMELKDYPNTGTNHSVVAFSYNGSTLIISTGWDRLYHEYAFDSLKCGQYVYVGY